MRSSKTTERKGDGKISGIVGRARAEKTVLGFGSCRWFSERGSYDKVAVGAASGTESGRLRARDVEILKKGHRAGKIVVLEREAWGKGQAARRLRAKRLVEDEPERALIVTLVGSKKPT